MSRSREWGDESSGGNGRSRRSSRGWPGGFHRGSLGMESGQAAGSEAMVRLDAESGQGTMGIVGGAPEGTHRPAASRGPGHRARGSGAPGNVTGAVGRAEEQAEVDREPNVDPGASSSLLPPGRPARPTVRWSARPQTPKPVAMRARSRGCPTDQVSARIEGRTRPSVPDVDGESPGFPFSLAIHSTATRSSSLTGPAP